MRLLNLIREANPIPYSTTPLYQCARSIVLTPAPSLWIVKPCSRSPAPQWVHFGSVVTFVQYWHTRCGDGRLLPGLDGSSGQGCAPLRADAELRACTRSLAVQDCGLLLIRGTRFAGRSLAWAQFGRLACRRGCFSTDGDLPADRGGRGAFRWQAVLVADSGHRIAKPRAEPVQDGRTQRSTSGR